MWKHLGIFLLHNPQSRGWLFWNTELKLISEDDKQFTILSGLQQSGTIYIFFLFSFPHWNHWKLFRNMGFYTESRKSQVCEHILNQSAYSWFPAHSGFASKNCCWLGCGTLEAKDIPLPSNSLPHLHQYVPLYYLLSLCQHWPLSSVNTQLQNIPNTRTWICKDDIDCRVAHGPSHNGAQHADSHQGHQRKVKRRLHGVQKGVWKKLASADKFHMCGNILKFLSRHFDFQLPCNSAALQQQRQRRLCKREDGSSQHSLGDSQLHCLLRSLPRCQDPIHPQPDRSHIWLLN